MELKPGLFGVGGSAYNPFNRTKWNWNEFDSIGMESLSSLLIVLNGIETEYDWNKTQSGYPFNRTKWNWNAQFNYIFADTDFF